MNTFITSHIHLKDVEDADIPALFQIIRQHRPFLGKYLDWILNMQTIHQAQEYFSSKISGALSEESLVIGIFVDNKIVGIIEVQDFEHALKSADLGFWLNPEYGKKGIMSQCVHEVLCFLFSEAGLNKVTAQYMTENSNSHRLLEKEGFKIEGILRDGTLHNGTFCDLVIAGLLKKEFPV